MLQLVKKDGDFSNDDGWTERSTQGLKLKIPTKMAYDDWTTEKKTSSTSSCRKRLSLIVSATPSVQCIQPAKEPLHWLCRVLAVKAHCSNVSKALRGRLTLLHSDSSIPMNTACAEKRCVLCFGYPHQREEVVFSFFNGLRDMCVTKLGALFS